MAKQSVSQTALGAAICRLIEQYQPQKTRLFDDPVVKDLVSTQTLEDIFAGTAFDPWKPAVFIWEGVTQYITEDAVRRTLAFAGKSAPGSAILFTYVLKSVIERKSGIRGADRLVERVAQSSPWIFGLEPSAIPSSPDNLPHRGG